MPDPATFTARTIHAGDDVPRIETGAFDLTPQLEQGRAVCNLFAEFLAGAPGEFRQLLPFLNKVQIEMQWAAAPGGAAFYAFFENNETIEMGVLLGGASPESDQQIVAALLESVAVPMLGDRAREWMAMTERPLALRIRLPDHPEIGPTMDLLAMALASVYFRAVFALAASGLSAEGGVH